MHEPQQQQQQQEGLQQQQQQLVVQQHLQKQRSLQSLLLQQQQQQLRQSEAEYGCGLASQQAAADAQLSDFMAVHAAVSSDSAASVHRSVSQMRLEQQQAQVQQQLRPWNQADRVAGLANSSAGSSSSGSPSSSSSSSKGERGWLKQQWQKLASSRGSKGKQLPYSSRSSGAVTGQHGDRRSRSCQRPSTAPGHLSAHSAAAAAAAGDTGGRLDTGSSSAARAAVHDTISGRDSSSAGAKQQQRQGTAVLEQQQAGEAMLGTATKRQGGIQDGSVCNESSSPQQQQDSTGQETAAPARQQQQKQRRASAFAGVMPLTDLWDPCEHPHASSIAAAAAARTVGCKLASSTAHFPYRWGCTTVRDSMWWVWMD
jgi:hypothetical protein